MPTNKTRDWKSGRLACIERAGPGFQNCGLSETLSRREVLVGLLWMEKGMEVHKLRLLVDVLKTFERCDTTGLLNRGPATQAISLPRYQRSWRHVTFVSSCGM